MRIPALGPVLVLAAVSIAHAVTIDHCGQVVTTGDTGVLAADLSCADGEVGVTLEPDATLSFAGYSMQSAGGVGPAVSCASNRCTIVGPGVLGAGEWDGIVGTAEGGRVVVRDLSIQDVASGIHTSFGKRVRLTVETVTLDHCLVGIITLGRLRATDVTVTNAVSYGLLARRLDGTNVIATNDNIYGVGGGRLRITGLVASGSTRGVNATRAILRESTVTGNGVDVVSQYRPVIRDTTCGTSQQPDGTTWGKCQND